MTQTKKLKAKIFNRALKHLVDKGNDFTCNYIDKAYGKRSKYYLYKCSPERKFYCEVFGLLELGAQNRLWALHDEFEVRQTMLALTIAIVEAGGL